MHDACHIHPELCKLRYVRTVGLGPGVCPTFNACTPRTAVPGEPARGARQAEGARGTNQNKEGVASWVASRNETLTANGKTTTRRRCSREWRACRRARGGRASSPRPHPRPLPPHTPARARHADPGRHGRGRRAREGGQGARALWPGAARVALRAAAPPAPPRRPSSLRRPRLAPNTRQALMEGLACGVHGRERRRRASPAPANNHRCTPRAAPHRRRGTREGACGRSLPSETPLRGERTRPGSGKRVKGALCGLFSVPARRSTA